MSLTQTELNNLMLSPSRKIGGKVEITYLRPFEDPEGYTPSVSEEGDYAIVEQLADRIYEPSYTWFSVPARMDRAYKALPPLADKMNYEMGWWSAQRADEDGYLDPPAVLDLDYTARPALAMAVVGDMAAGCYPVDFLCEIYNGPTLVKSLQVTGNTDVSWGHINEDGQDLQSTKFRVTIQRINKGRGFARILEIGISIQEIYVDRLIGIKLLEELHYQSSTVPIGSTSANELVVTMDNRDRRLDPRNPDSPVVTELKKNRRIRAWLSVPGNLGPEWYPLGTFYTTNWNVDYAAKQVSVRALDILELMRYSTYRTPVRVGWTLKALFEDVLLDFGLLASNVHVDDSLDSIIIPYAWYQGASHRDALNALSSIHLAFVNADRMGGVVVSEINTAAPSKFLYSDDQNIIARGYSMAQSAQVNQVRVTATTYAPGTSMVVWETAESFSVPVGGEVLLDITYTTQPVMPGTVLAVTGAGLVGSVVAEWSGAAQLSISNPTGSPINCTGIQLTGVPLTVQGTMEAVAEDLAVIQEEGVLVSRHSHWLLQSITTAQQLADAILGKFGTSEYDVDMSDRGHVALPVGSVVTVSDSVGGQSEDYILVRQNLQWQGSMSAQTTVRTKGGV